MALIIKDRVKEITTTTGTGAVSLGGASATFDAFQSVMSNGDTTFYAIVHTASATDEWEVGLGTWNTGNTLTRTTVYAGSSGTSAVNFSSGNKDVFMTYPASKATVAGEDVTFADITATNITSTGTVTLSADPSSALQAATKQYVDTIAAAGLHYHAPVRVQTTANLSATYSNGSSGVGATLTNSGTNAAITIDSVALSSADRVLVSEQTDQTQNGVYTVTTVGDGSTAWVLTRSTDTDSYAPSDGDSLGQGDAFFVKEGDTNAGHLDVMTTTGTITFGTTNIVFAEVAETSIYSAGTGLTLTGTTFSTNQDISTSASPTFAGATVNGNITVTGTVDGRDVATDGTKLDGIEAGATADQTAAEIKTAYESNSDTNAFTDTEKTKLSGIESGATADQTASEILTAIKTVDGSASGLDADLLDGQQGSYYLNTSTSFSGDVSGTYNAISLSSNTVGASELDVTGNGTTSQFLRSDGDGSFTWATPTDTNTTDWRVANSAGTEQFAVSAAEQVRFAASGAASVAFNSSTQTITFSSTDTNTDTNTTYALTAAQTGGTDANPNLFLNASSGTDYNVQLVGSGATTVTRNSDGQITISSTDTNTDTTNFNIQANSGTQVNISAGEEINFINGDATTAVVTNQANPTVTFNHNDTSSQASVNNSDGTVIQDVTLDTYGHVTGLASLDGDARWVNVTGDTMTGALVLDHNTGPMLKLQATNGSPWALELGRDDATNSKVYNGGGYWAFEHEPRYYNAGTHQKLFHDGYHPNADKWTTARTLSLSGDASGSVSWDGSANATLSVTVANDSHTHSTQYTSIDEFDWRGTGYLTSTTTSALKTELLNRDVFDSYVSAFKTGWSYAGNGDLTDAGRLTELAGTSWLTWTDNSTDNTQGNFTALVIAPNTGGSAGKMFVYNDQGSSYAPGWREIWTSTSDGSGSGLDADLLDGNHASAFATLSGATFTGRVYIDTATNDKLILRGSDDPSIELQNSSDAFRGRLGVSNTNKEIRVVGQDPDNTSAIHMLGIGQNGLRYSTNNGLDWYKVWHANNDGSGSGLDADTLDGVHGSSYLRSDADDSMSGILTFTSSNNSFAEYNGSGISPYLRFKTSNVNNGYIQFTASGYAWFWNDRINQGIKVESGTSGLQWYTGGAYSTVWHSTNDGSGSGLDADLWDGNEFASYLNQAVLSTSSPSFAGLNINGNLNAVDHIYLAGSLYHEGDTDTRLLFSTNTITLQCGGSSEITVNTTGVRLGDTGNGYFQPVSGTYGSVQVDGGAHGGYEGYSIGGRAVFMHDNSAATGIYNDVDNEWLWYGGHNGSSYMYFNGGYKLNTTSTGVTVTGDLNSTSDIRYKKNIETIDSALEKVQSLRGVTFDWDNDAFEETEFTKKPNFTERATGVIAQDVEKVLPEAVRENEDGFKNVAYGNMVGLLIEAIKEQQEQIDELKKQLNG